MGAWARIGTYVGVSRRAVRRVLVERPDLGPVEVANEVKPRRVEVGVARNCPEEVRVGASVGQDRVGVGIRQLWGAEGGGIHGRTDE